MAVSVNPDVNPYYNALIATDVNDDGITTAIDALMIINRLNSEENGPLSLDGVSNGERLDLTDVNNDGMISPLDALIVINQLNQGLSTAVVQPAEPTPEEQLASSTSAADSIFGSIGATAEGEQSAAAFLFDAELIGQRRRR